MQRWSVVGMFPAQTRLSPRPDLLRRPDYVDGRMGVVTRRPDQALTVEISLTDPPTSVRLDTLLTGRTFTHRLTAQEIEDDVLPITPDFAAIWPLLGIAPYDTVDGAPATAVFDEDAANPEAGLRLKTDALQQFSIDSLVGVRVAGDGLYLSDESAPDELGQLMRTTQFVALAEEMFGVTAKPQNGTDDGPESGGSIALDEFLQLGCVRDPDLFTTPGRPVADLLDELGLDHDNGQIALQGFDFDAEQEALAHAADIERIVDTYDLADDEAAVVVAFTDAVHGLHEAVHEWVDAGEMEEDFPQIDVGELVPLLSVLAEPMVAVAIADENLTGDSHLGSILQVIMQLLESHVPRRTQAGWHWLRGRCADLLGRVTDAEDSFAQALDLDADFYPAMRELATLASVRGDADRAVSLLNRAGVPADDDELSMVARYAGEARTNLSRNGPCWCGSGQKYKKCHLGKSDFDLASRRDWLYYKICDWVGRGIGGELIVELAAVSIGPAADPDELLGAIGNPLMMDVAIFEGRLIDEFLISRGALLPRDEQELLIQWPDTRRSLYSITEVPIADVSMADVETQTRLTLKDLATGSTVHISHSSTSHSSTSHSTTGYAIGDLVCARLLPAGESHAAPGGLVVVPRSRAELRLAMLELQGTDDEDPVRTVAVLTGAS